MFLVNLQNNLLTTAQHGISHITLLREFNDSRLELLCVSIFVSPSTLPAIHDKHMPQTSAKRLAYIKKVIHVYPLFSEVINRQHNEGRFGFAALPVGFTGS